MAAGGGRAEQRPGERVETDLRARIGAGEWAPGAQLPSVAALAGHYGVSPGVVQRVHQRLAADGLIRVVAGWGVFRAS
jgi:DNA-binding GntR family transcriptional regulator